MKRISDRLYSICVLCTCGLLLASCSSKLKITSDPEQVDIFIVNPENGTKDKIGTTPIEKRDDEVKQFLDQLGPGQLAQLSAEKEGFDAKDIFVPVSGSGTLAFEMKVKLIPSPKVDEEQAKKEEEEKKKAEELKTAEQIVSKLFLAQKFANSQQMERAHIELDKILEIYPQFTRALSMKASVFYAENKLNESLEFYEKAIEVDPETDIAVRMAAQIRKKLGKEKP